MLLWVNLLAIFVIVVGFRYKFKIIWENQVKKKGHYKARTFVLVIFPLVLIRFGENVFV